MSLQDFVLENQQELIKRTRAKVAKRPSPHPTEAQMQYGVPLFLSQLASSLSEEEARDPAQKAEADPPSNLNDNIAISAGLHGQTLRKLGFTIEQVVHDYGDVCQAVTELAVEREATVTNAEFHTLNRCLDNAIAEAVSAWSKARDMSIGQGCGRRDLCRRELLNLVSIATVSFDALRQGRVGSAGAAATMIGQCLTEMGSILENPNWAAD
jgi:hypothetical protein